MFQCKFRCHTSYDIGKTNMVTEKPVASRRLNKNPGDLVLNLLYFNLLQNQYFFDSRNKHNTYSLRFTHGSD